MQRGPRPPGQKPSDAGQRPPTVRRTVPRPSAEHPPSHSTLRPTADLQSEAWGHGEAQPASRTIPRSTLTRSPVDRTQPMPHRVPSGNRTLQPPAAGGNGARSTVSPKPSAYRSPRPAPTAEQQAASDAEVERLGQQIVELLERVRQGDERAAYLEQQLQHMTHMANAAAAAATALPQPMLSVSDDVRTPKANNSWIAWTAFGLLGALVVAAYVFGYVPLRSQYEELSKQSVLQASQSASQLEKLKTSFSEERSALQSQLAAAQAAASAAAQPAAAEPATSRSRSSAAESDDDEDSGSSRLSAEEREAKKAERLAKREERKAAYEAKKAERLAKREERKAAAEERKAARAESSSSRKHASDDEDEPTPSKPAKPASRPADDGDDPLQGLDGL